MLKPEYDNSKKAEHDDNGKKPETAYDNGAKFLESAMLFLEKVFEERRRELFEGACEEDLRGEGEAAEQRRLMGGMGAVVAVN